MKTLFHHRSKARHLASLTYCTYVMYVIVNKYIFNATGGNGVKRGKYNQGDHSTCAKPPVDFKTKVPLWPGQARAGQAKTELLY